MGSYQSVDLREEATPEPNREQLQESVLVQASLVHFDLFLLSNLL